MRRHRSLRSAPGRGRLYCEPGDGVRL